LHTLPNGTADVLVGCLQVLSELVQSQQELIASMGATGAFSKEVFDHFLFSMPASHDKENSSSATVRVATRALASRVPVVGGNWKCNPESPDKLPELIANINACDTSGCEVYVCPSPLHVPLVQGKFTNGAVVAPQNMNFTGCGAYTGEVAVEQMKAMGMSWVLIGHSERRGEFGLPTPAESSELLATKCKYALDAGMKVVYAIGEPLPVREKGIDAVLAYCIEQLKPFADAGLLDPAKVVIAYEPVWSIGTGVTASPEQAQETHAAIRGWLKSAVGAACADGMRIQYGGSANAKNAPELSACPDVDGFLVGGASLKAEFADIVSAVAKAKA